MKDIEKYFRVYAEVNLDAIIKNIEMMREKIKPETGIVGVIKTDGYGHGAVPIAKALENDMRWLCSSNSLGRTQS